MRWIVLLALLLPACTPSRTCGPMGCWDPAMSKAEREEVCRLVEKQLERERAASQPEESQ